MAEKILGSWPWGQIEQKNILEKREFMQLFQILDIDPAMTLTKIRLITEKMVLSLYTANIPPSESKENTRQTENQPSSNQPSNQPYNQNFGQNPTLAKMLYDLKVQGGVLPDFIYKSLNFIRLIGNSSAHPPAEPDEPPVDLNLVVEGLIPMFISVVQWFICEHLKISIPPSSKDEIKSNNPSKSPLSDQKKPDLPDQSDRPDLAQLASILVSNQKSILLTSDQNSKSIEKVDAELRKLQEERSRRQLQLPIIDEQRKRAQNNLGLCKNHWDQAKNDLENAEKELRERYRWVENAKKPITQGGKIWRLADCQSAVNEWTQKVYQYKQIESAAANAVNVAAQQAQEAQRKVQNFQDGLNALEQSRIFPLIDHKKVLIDENAQLARDLEEVKVRLAEISGRPKSN